MNEVLKLEHIQKYYGSKGNVTKAIQDISFSVQEGEFVGIMGASGSGKTTLLNCISTIDTVSAGHIYLNGTDVTEINEKQIARFRRENLGFVFQDFNLLDTLTISENIALALTINRVPAGEIDGSYPFFEGNTVYTVIPHFAEKGSEGIVKKLKRLMEKDLREKGSKT